VSGAYREHLRRYRHLLRPDQPSQKVARRLVLVIALHDRELSLLLELTALKGFAGLSHVEVRKGEEREKRSES
jgi:hypothetical protein